MSDDADVQLWCDLADVDHEVLRRVAARQRRG
jgi:hypothetical protein